MLRRLNLVLIFRRLTHTESDVIQKSWVPSQEVQTIDTRVLRDDDIFDVKPERRSVLEECNEDISHISTYLKPTFNFAAYVNKSETLQQLVKLGVSLHILERKRDVPQFILGLDFERDMKNHIIFLSELGISDDKIGPFLTKNPLIFREDLDNLSVRVNYLKSKRFTEEMITSIVSRNPNWLMFSTQDIDNRLGYFQKEYDLTGKEVRSITMKQPKLITYSMKHIKLNTFVFKEEMGFTPDETKFALLRKPNLFMKWQIGLLKTFEFIHKTMKVPIERIAELPEVLTCREFRIKQRHLFLEHLGKAQYNHREPNYVSILTLVSGSDEEFCSEVAKSSVQEYNTFLKSL